jgi:hypothetical protein
MAGFGDDWADCSSPTDGSRSRNKETREEAPQREKLHVRMHARVRANTCVCRPPFVAGLRDESCRRLRFRKRG